MKYRMTTLAVAAALALSAASQADSFDETLVQAEPENTRSMVIRYHPVELQTADGQERIHRQIKSAAEEVCGPQNMRDAGSLSILRHNRACYDKAIAAANAQMSESQVATR